METACFKTKLGWITVKKNRGNVYSLSFGKTNKTIDLINIKNQINLYASGKLKNFKINYSFEGSPLQKKSGKNCLKFNMVKFQHMEKLQKKLVHLQDM